ncbi:MAG: histidine kinase [Gemmatimonadota bacterium]|nr:MAG: histidine kinase [Gemmatimonadota bacterium]
MLVKRLSFWTVQLSVWGAYGLSTYLSGLPSLAEAEMFTMLGVKLLRAALGLVLSLGLYVLYSRAMRRTSDIKIIATLAVAASLVISGVWQLLYLAAQSPPWGDTALSVDWASFRMAFPDYAFVMLAWSAAYLGIEFWRYSRLQEQRALEAKALAREAQLQSLSYQLNPHFLFNALNSIRALIQENAQKAREMVTQLSEFLRYTLVNPPLDEIPLRDEVEALRRYLAIEEARFEDRLTVSIDVERSAEDWTVPGLILHPLVENAIKHGIGTSPRPLQVKIEARVEGHHLHIEVANTGALAPAAEVADAPASADAPDGAGIGLENVRERLARLYPDAHRFEVAQHGDWVRAVIEIRQPALRS